MLRAGETISQGGAPSWVSSVKWSAIFDFCCRFGDSQKPQWPPERVLLSFSFFLYWETQWKILWKSFKKWCSLVPWVDLRSHGHPFRNGVYLLPVWSCDCPLSSHYLPWSPWWPQSLLDSGCLCPCAVQPLFECGWHFTYDLLVTHELQRRCWISFLRWKHLPYCFCSLSCFPVCVLKWSAMLGWFMSLETVGSLTERPQIKQKVSHGSSKPTSGSFPSKTFSWDLSSGHQLDFSPWEDLGTEKVLCRAWSLNPQMLWDNKYKLFFNTLLNLWFFITLNSLFNFFLSCT